MQTQLPPRTLFSFAISLLFLSMAPAKRGCSCSAPQLLSQLQSQANITGDMESLLEPYIRLQSLSSPALRAACTGHPAQAFPSEDTLRHLSKSHFLNTVYVTLERVWHQLGALREQFLKTRAFLQLEWTRQNIQGIRNNVYCMARLLRHPLEITQVDSGVSPSPTTASGTFKTKIDSCRFLWGYHRFMGSVGRVFREWENGSRRSRRHSPLRAWRKGARRI
ncbi:oncostatin-M isoform X1 [Mastomys coucha]|uniref:oncostatin-M isoform X1 n=2 Tax=Mastomys coucha TaxID=35658 RepID=UPI0012624F86|nr:oncostatin-M isoform X1 [Mastomys coucha]